MEGSLLSTVLLLLNGCKLDILDSQSRSAIDIAQQYKNKPIEDWLSKKGK